MAYTKPALRERIVAAVKAGTKGGKAGQWSARKAQIANQRYKAAGGGFTGPKTDKQKSLSQWTAEKWRTSDGKPAIRNSGTTRYLPEKAWNQLSAAEKQATNRKKLQVSKQGRQFVANTKAAKTAGRNARRRKP